MSYKPHSTIIVSAHTRDVLRSIGIVEGSATEPRRDGTVLIQIDALTRRELDAFVVAHRTDYDGAFRLLCPDAFQ